MAGFERNFNHPTKELLFAVRTEVNEDANLWTNYTVPSTVGGHDAVNPVAAAKLTLNGHDRFSERAGPYFNLVQPFQYHSNIPKSRGINVYSFALKPEEHQPSGQEATVKAQKAFASSVKNRATLLDAGNPPNEHMTTTSFTKAIEGSQVTPGLDGQNVMCLGRSADECLSPSCRDMAPSQRLNGNGREEVKQLLMIA